jgi:hypothetical protein
MNRDGRSSGLLAALVLLVACSEQEFNLAYIPPAPGDMTIRGRVCDPLLQTWMEGAFVYTNLYDEANDVVYDTRTSTTDENGYYALEDLIGGLEYEIYVQKGPDIIEQYIVELTSGGDLTLPDPPCFADVDALVAVISGSYDDLEPALSAAGVNVARVIDGQRGDEIVDFLSDAANLEDYQVLFFDGGHQEDGVFYGSDAGVATVQANLRAFVEGGGSVFASDWSYDVVEQLWPTKVDWVGDDAVPDAAQSGEPGDVVASVSNSGLLLSIGLETVTVAYDLSEWPLIESVDPSVAVYLEGDAHWRQGMEVTTIVDSPLLIGFQEGDGQVIFTTYRNAANASGGMLSVLIAMVESLDGP